jgi:hypothetical protein
VGESVMLFESYEGDRKEIFLRVVRLQDQGVNLEDSRTCVSIQYGIDLDDIREIEAEGIMKKWPPL